jgi:hypothetical protein
MRGKWPPVLLAVSIALSALTCGPLGEEPETATAPPPTSPPATPSNRAPCGDGICDEHERKNPALCPQDCVVETATSEEPTPHPGDASPAGYITFSINIHDFLHVDDSADTVLRLVDLFEAYGVRGDFYFTAPMVHTYAEQRPDVLERLTASDMTIGFHIRPPHPLYAGFDQRLDGLDEVTLSSTIRDYETYRLDMSTGELLRDQPGGYSYISDVFGRPPVSVAGIDQKWRPTALPILDELGAQMTVTYHETGTDLEEPFEWTHGLLVRPSDFSITRWTTPERPNELFWWNMLDTEYADQYIPATRLQQELAAWDGDRAPFITVLIHENNFFRQNATPWALIYYTDRQKTTPLTPPFDLGAPDGSEPRTIVSHDHRQSRWLEYVNRSKRLLGAAFGGN